MRLIFLLTMFLGAIGINIGHAKEYNPKKLTASASTQSYELRAPYVAKASSWGHVFTYKLNPGIYVRTFELKDGYILVGPENSFEQSILWKPRNKPAWTEHHEYGGAIFVSTRKMRGARPLFFIPDHNGSVDPNTAQGISQNTTVGSTGASAAGGALGGIIVNSLIASHSGKISTVDGLEDDPKLSDLLVEYLAR